MQLLPNFACRFIRGNPFVNTRLLSSCTRCSISEALFQPLPMSVMEGALGQHSRSTADQAPYLLPARSGLPRLCHLQEQRIHCHWSQVQHKVKALLPLACRPNQHERYIRSCWCVNHLLLQQRLPPRVAPIPCQGPDGQASDPFDQNLRSRAHTDCPAVSVKMAVETVLQMDETAPPYRGFSRHQRERCRRRIGSQFATRTDRNCQ